MKKINRLPGGLIPWLCEYKFEGGWSHIVLYGTDKNQVIRENQERLPGLMVCGEALGMIPLGDEPTE